MWNLFVWNPTSVKNRIYGPDTPIIREMGAFLAVAVQPHLRSVLFLCFGVLLRVSGGALFEPHQYRIRSVVGPQGCSREPFITGGVSRSCGC